MTGSNRRHPPCKGGALPAELITRSCFSEVHSTFSMSYVKPLFEKKFIFFSSLREKQWLNRCFFAIVLLIIKPLTLSLGFLSR